MTIDELQLLQQDFSDVALAVAWITRHGLIDINTPALIARGSILTTFGPTKRGNNT